MVKERQQANVALDLYGEKAARIEEQVASKYLVNEYQIN